MKIKRLLALSATLLVVLGFIFSPQSFCGDFATPPADANS